MRFVLVVATLALASCTLSPVDPRGRACDATHACTEGTTCVAGRCDAICTSDTDCAPGQRCVASATRCPNFDGACPNICAVFIVEDAGNAGEGEGNAGEGEGESDAGPKPDPNAPTLSAPQVPAQTSHGEVVDVPLTSLANDVDGDKISFVVVAQPLHGTASASADGVSYTPKPGFAGFDAIGVVASDGQKESAPVDVEVYVVGRSCAHVLTEGGARGDGLYTLDLEPDAGPGPDGGTRDEPVFCDMTDNGGGWSLAMKVDGANDTFCFTKTTWTDGQTLNPTDVTLARGDAKLDPFVETPAGEVLVKMQNENDGELGSLAIPFSDGTSDTTLAETIALGSAVISNRAANDFTALAPSHANDVGTLFEQGLNAVRSNDVNAAARIGVVGQIGCCGQQTAIGVGLKSNACGGDYRETAGVDGLNGCCTQVADPALALVFVRSRDFTFLPPIASCNLDQGLVLGGKYLVDADGPGGALPQPTTCDFGDFHALVLFDASQSAACPDPLVPNQAGPGCVRGVPEGGPVSLVFPTPIPYQEVRVVVDAVSLGTPNAFLPSTTSGIDIDHVYVDGISVTTSTTTGGPRQHAFTFAAGPCPCAPANGTAAPGFVGNNFACDDTNPLFDFDALDHQCHQLATPNSADVTVTSSTGPVEVRVMTDEAEAVEDIAITKLEVFVR
jgi:hypothetical protein